MSRASKQQTNLNLQSLQNPNYLNTIHQQHTTPPAVLLPQEINKRRDYEMIPSRNFTLPVVVLCDLALALAAPALNDTILTVVHKPVMKCHKSNVCLVQNFNV